MSDTKQTNETLVELVRESILKLDYRELRDLFAHLADDFGMAVTPADIFAQCNLKVARAMRAAEDALTQALEEKL